MILGRRNMKEMEYNHRFLFSSEEVPISNFHF
ncbi:unnamed protein product [Phytomonas sp. EM1]|nr:unnamed protein product [Phytomonas sp. EM1]|eukprot:CCW60146.1 unnamed protein product [Phytomonas sp. isolate EM1]